MDRVTEPQLMTDPEQVEAYATADFSETNQGYGKQFAARFPDAHRSALALDLCCGSGDITVRFAQAYSGWTIHGVDGSRPMLERAERHGVRAGVGARLRWIEATLPTPALTPRAYDVVLSTGALHHFHDPAVFWSAVRASARIGGTVFVTDFFRPGTEEEAELLVRRYAGDAPEVLRRDYRNSLRAAFTPDEIRLQVLAHGMGDLVVEVISDRHVVVAGRAAASPRARGD